MGEYNRLSKEDGDKPESDSIQNQHSINQKHLEYLREQGEQIESVTVYSDDGYAGGNFKRPRYQALIRDIESGKINCIIFKDNSRLGRNYPELGRLMEDYFPQKGVRVISVLNNLDSVKDPRGYCSAIVSFSNIVNDDYIRQLSIKIKCTLTMKRERGEFIGNYAPFGYQKDPADRHRLVVDEEQAEIVRKIFDWYEDGMSASSIAKRLNAMQIMTPGDFKIRDGCKSFITHDRNSSKLHAWTTTTIATILKNEVYIGNMVQGKHKSVSYRSKKMMLTDESEWTVVEGTHAPIISDEQFAIIHERFARRTRISPGKTHVYPLSGLVSCGACGHRMNRVVSQGYARYRCITRTYAPDKCQCPSIKEEYLEELILQTLQSLIARLVDVKAVIDAARQFKTINGAKNEYMLALNKAKREQERLQDAQFHLYDDLQSGLIPKTQYLQFQKRYETEIAAQEAKIEHLNQGLLQLKEARQQDDEFVAFFQKYGNIQKLDWDTVNQLIQKVVFHDKQHVDIYFRFADEYEKLCGIANVIREQETVLCS
ncbi:MAG: recombinase family protein [Butyricicoccus sp.]|nr:recombinase family protein [Butyricicoccus sp.]